MCVNDDDDDDGEGLSREEGRTDFVVGEEVEDVGQNGGGEVWYGCCCGWWCRWFSSFCRIVFGVDALLLVCVSGGGQFVSFSFKSYCVFPRRG